MISDSKILVNTLSLTAVLTTVAVNPWFAYDPINLPKMLILVTGAGFLFAILTPNLKLVYFQSPFLVISALLLGLTLIVSIFLNTAPITQQIWGTWGRSTGLVTYLSFLVIMCAALTSSNQFSISKVRHIFEKLSYFVTSYTLLQYLDLDPINWSQKLMIATLGNLNFMSSFLGLASISFFARIFAEKHSFIAKLYYGIILVLNLFLIWASESIQGIGVLLAGVTLIVLQKVFFRFEFIYMILSLFAATLIGFVVLAGTAGVGPLSILRQETVEFRLDYWRAGLSMLYSNPWSGIGIDSYGDFYREYRNLDAITRTGPQRVANTAHNVFLDVSTGAGLFAGILFILIMASTLIIILLRLRSKLVSNDYLAISAMWMGFVVFMLISINQIGVGVWGFIFTGLLHGKNTCESSNFSKGKDKKVNKSKLDGIDSRKKGLPERENLIVPSELSWPRITSSISALCAFVIAIVPNVADIKFLTAIKTGNLDSALNLSTGVGIQSFHREILMVRLNEASRFDDALDLARTTVASNPRNWSGWVQIAFGEASSSQERTFAANRLYALDPLNLDVRKDFETRFAR